MSPLLFLSIALLISVVGSLVLWLRHRAPTSYDSGIRDFQREMRALAPQTDDDDQNGRWRKGRR